MNQRLLTGFFCVLAALLPSSGRTATADFDTVTVPVQNQSAAERDRALRQGLADIFVRVSGSRTVLVEPAVKAVLAQPEGYALEVGFTHLAAQNDGPPPLALRARYARNAVEKLLRQAQLPVWSANRPEWLVVVVEDAPGGRTLIGRDDNLPVWRAMDAAMARRGVGSKAPLLDLEDQTALTADVAWAVDEESLNRFSRRYGAAHWFVLGYRVGGGGRWQGEWALGGEAGGGTLRGELVGDDVGVVAAGMIDIAVDRFSARVASRVAPTAGHLALVIENVRSHRAFSAVATALTDLAGVTSARAQSIDRDRVDYRLEVDGDPAAVLAALARDHRFASLPAADVGAGPATESPPLRLRWLTP